jgi:hypothetical protein
MPLFEKENETSRERRLAREKRQHDILTMSTEQLQQEVLAAPPQGETAELGINFVRKK